MGLTRVLFATLPLILPAAAQAADRPVVAVFDIENKGAKLRADTVSMLSDLLDAELAGSGAFQTVPRDEIRHRLELQKKDSYRPCVAQACRIELGQELAAQKFLSTHVMKLGKTCVITSTLYDLRRAIADRGATAEGSCGAEAMVTLLKEIVRKLVHPLDVFDPTPATGALDPEPTPGRIADDRSACEQGVLVRCLALAHAYRTGTAEVSADPEKAASLYRRACDGDLGAACFAYGWMTKRGLGVEKSLERAATLLDRACTLGDMAGCTELALGYESGEGVRQSSRRALELYQKACDGNYAWGCGGLGWMLKYGRGQDADYVRAGAMLERACDGGDLGACSELAGLHQAGLGRVQNSKRAVELYQKSCDGGWAFGCGGLGWMYRYGYGVRVDRARARRFLGMGCDKGDQGACRGLADLDRTRSKDQ